VGYVEDLNDATCLREALRRRQGTQLADFFSILLVRLLGTVKADNKLDRAMVGFALVARAGDLAFPVRRAVVKSAGGFATLGDGRPWFAGSGDMNHKAAYGERDKAALRTLSLCHAKTTRLFSRGV
jgi:hypothetical protein